MVAGGGVSPYWNLVIKGIIHTYLLTFTFGGNPYLKIGVGLQKDLRSDKFLGPNLWPKILRYQCISINEF